MKDTIKIPCELVDNGNSMKTKLSKSKFRFRPSSKISIKKAK